jgi:pimeloyl-ACP methyl ester carboxylesterase
MVGDVVGLLDTLELSTAVIVGHDWGAQIAWACAQLFPERFPAIVALSVPYQVRTPVPMTQALREWAGNTFNWLLYFQEPGVAEAALGADVARTMRMITYGLSGDAGELGLRLVTGLPKDADLLDSIPEPDALPAWLSESELAHYIEEFERTGFIGGLNRYRNVDRDWHELPALGATTVQQPVLLAAGEHDSATRYMDVKTQREYVPNLREPVIFEGCGHWIQQERAERVNGLLDSFLRDMAAAPEVLWG